ncbi:MAG: acetyltransferase [Actinomycetota bacterium]|nr:acetyltransferase [Actinomycetota bacterium]
MKPLLLVGAGGFGREAAEVVRAINAERPTWDLLGFLDDGVELVGTQVDGVPVLGPLSAVERFPVAQVVVCTGHPGNYFTRKRLVRRLRLPASRYATLAHPTAVLPASAELGPGTVVLATAVATARVRIGAHVAIMPGVVLTHDDVVADYATLAAGARLAGRVRVGEGAYIGSGALVREDRSIGAWSLIGMGAVVTRDVPDCQVWVGVPARYLRAVSVPPDARE